MDLTLWQDSDGNLLAFQLAYDKGDGERVIEWHNDTGFRHHRVDDGEAETGRYKQTPLLLPDGIVPRDRLLAEFGRRSAEIEAYLRRAILEALMGLPE